VNAPRVRAEIRELLLLATVNAPACAGRDARVAVAGGSGLRARRRKRRRPMTFFSTRWASTSRRDRRLRSRLRVLRSARRDVRVA